MATNNALNNQCRSDFTVLNSNLIVGDAVPAVPLDLNVQKSKSGANVEIECRNTSNTASSNAILGIVVAGASAGDPYLTYNVATVNNWSHGIRNADSDAWYLSPGSSLATTPSIRVALDGNTTINYTASGATGGLNVNNTNNTASSQAYVSINTAGTTAGNALIQLSNTVDSVFSISHASATNSPLIFSGGNPGTNDSFRISVAGRTTNPLQPAFDYYNNATNTNATGDGTSFNLIFNTVAAGGAQQGSSWDGTSTFTAPVTGWYQFNIGVRMTGFSTQTSAYTTFTHTATQTYYGQALNPINVFASTIASAITLVQSVLMKMTAGDTMQATAVVGGGAKTVSIDGTQADTYINGVLIC